MQDNQAALFESFHLIDEYLHVCASSPFVAEALSSQKDVVESFLKQEQWLLLDSISQSHFHHYVQEKYIGQDVSELSETQFKSVLRQFRYFYSARILWLDLNGQIDWRTLFRLQSELADTCMQAALGYVQNEFSKKYHQPKNSDGENLELCVVAMGKWGGGELNFSSDIDYIYLFSENGEVSKLAGTRSLSHQEYFTKQAQKINQILDDVTAAGFVYRCDTRLRPFGDSGPLVVSISALEQYLFEHGREWERYAYLKARCVTGDEIVKKEFLELRKPFVYRRYLDYGVFESLREMHTQISSQVKKKQIEDDIKLGRGGIRECEFLVQSHQLIRGGRESHLQKINFYSAYKQLCEKDIFFDEDQRFLKAYVFHRLLENRLQGLHQQQTHQLPSSKEDHAALVQAMGFTDWPELLNSWEQHRAVVAKRFDEQARLFKLEKNTEAVSHVILLEAELESLQTQFTKAGIEPSQHAKGFKQDNFYKHLRDKRKRLVDQLLFNYFKYLNVEVAAERLDINVIEDIDRRFLSIIKAIGGRQTYFSLLIEHPQALHNVVTLCAKSEFLSQQISEHPILLDELLDARIFQNVPTMQSVHAEVLTLQAHIENSDVETFVQRVLLIKNSQIFRIALADVTGTLSLMKVSDCLTTLAESILSVVLDFVSLRALQKFKLPNLDWKQTGFSVIAYGKLGGLELAYSSDLDIVFLFDESQFPTDCLQSNDMSIIRQYYHRIAQQCIRILDMPTISGRLYEVDTRLRPSGKSGFLVSSFEAFAKYQAQEAWVWEHQALARTRAILGSEHSIAQFASIRYDVLVHKIKRNDLKTKVIEMRVKMRQELGKLSDTTKFHLKHSQGGMIDIEFLVQYLVLAHAQDFPSLIAYSDNVRQLEAISELSAELETLPNQIETKTLTRIYLSLRARAHKLGLEGLAPVIDAVKMEADRTLVTQIWEKYLQIEV